eukprot:SAG31_NODE_4574_length_3124_cov_3.152397_1_plen_156_part_10
MTSTSQSEGSFSSIKLAKDFHAAIRRVASSLSFDQLEHLRCIVDARTHSGCVTLESWLAKFEMRCHSPGWEEHAFERLREDMKRKKMTLRDLVRRVDTDNSGSVSVAEFARGIVAVAPSFSKEEAFDLAQAADVHCIGMVDMATISQKLTNARMED